MEYFMKSISKYSIILQTVFFGMFSFPDIKSIHQIVEVATVSANIIEFENYFALRDFGFLDVSVQYDIVP